MRIRMGELRTLVLETAITAATVSPSVGLIVRDGNGYASMALVRLGDVRTVLSGGSQNPYETLSRAIIGGISIVLTDVWRVTNVKADKGYGPLLYRLAMQYATRRGSSLSSDPDGSTSSDAQRVWDRFAEQPDVETVFLGDEYGDQRDVAFQLEGDDSVVLVGRYVAALAGFDQATRAALDEMLDEAIGEAVATFG